MKQQHDPIVHEVLRQIPYGLFAIGVRGDNGDMNAFVGSWLTQCSFDPPLIMAAVRLDTSSFDLVQKGRRFTVNLLDQSQHALAKILVRPAHSAGNKLDQLAWHEAKTGAPVIDDAFAFLDCKVREIYKPGDHGLVIGEIVNAEQRRAATSLRCEDLHWHYAG